MTSNESRRTPSDYNVELGDEITARTPSKRRRILGGIAVAICLSVASLIIVLAALRVQRDRDARDSLQMEQLREGWRTLVGTAGIDPQRAADPVTVAAPVAPVAASADTTAATASAEPAPPAATDTVIVPVPVRPTRAPAPLRARAIPTRTYNSQPAHSAGQPLDNPLPIDVPKPVTPDGSNVNAPEQGATGVGSEAQPSAPSDSASQPVPVQPDDAAKSAPTPPLPTGSVPDSEPAPPLPSGSVPDSVP